MLLENDNYIDLILGITKCRKSDICTLSVASSTSSESLNSVDTTEVGHAMHTTDTSTQESCHVWQKNQTLMQIEDVVWRALCNIHQDQKTHSHEHMNRTFGFCIFHANTPPKCLDDIFRMIRDTTEASHPFLIMIYMHIAIIVAWQYYLLDTVNKTGRYKALYTISCMKSKYELLLMGLYNSTIPPSKTRTYIMQYEF